MSDYGLKITTDGKWRDFKYRYEVPEKVLRKDFEWTTEDDIDGYFRHHGTWYHLSMFERTNVKGWDGQHPDSFTTGELVKVSSDGEQYKVGRYRVVAK